MKYDYQEYGNQQEANVGFQYPIYYCNYSLIHAALDLNP